MKSKFPPGMVLWASVNFVFAIFLVAHSNAQTPEEPVQITVTSASGAERHPPPSCDKTVDRVGLRPGQLVSVTLQFPVSYSGQAVVIGALDGGEVTAGENLLVSSEGKVQWDFQGGKTLGLYRISVLVGMERYFLQFCVLDPVDSTKNPPGLQIVD